MKTNILLILIIAPLISYCQFSDDFSDGDFLYNPQWTGDITEFTVNNSLQLQLNQTIAPPSGESDTSCLVTASQLTDSAEWSFWLKLSFSPSNNNLVRVYLISDMDNLKLPLHGYFVQMGENGSFDSVDLFRQDGTSVVKIIDGIDGHCAASSNTLKIKVIRHSSGLWQLYSSVTGNNNFQPEGSVTDLTWVNSLYFGIFCKYTSSNACRFFFDDISVSHIIVDLQPPVIQQITVIPAKKVVLRFSEPVGQTNSELTSNYFLNNGMGNPLSVVRDSADLSCVQLEFQTSFQMELTYSLTIHGIDDLSGNVMQDTILSFSYYLPQPYDIVINEIMADPDPVVDLPDFEYIELFNASSYDLTLAGWKLKVGSSTKEIPDVVMNAGSYLVLCSTSAVSDFSAYGNSLGIPASPSLTNAGQTITITDSSGVTISTVSYTDQWYQDPLKQDGGWSLEKIDPLNNCSGITNWRASVNSQGGSPGQQNSVMSANMDNTPPSLLAVEVCYANHLILYFNESLGAGSVSDTSAFVAESNVGSPYSASIQGNNQDMILLSFSKSFPEKKEISLSISHISDVCNNVNDQITTQFTWYVPREFDVLINEIMADPDPGVGLPEYDYLELYNHSEYDISLKDWTLTIGENVAVFPFVIIQAGNYYIITSPAAVTALASYGQCLGLISPTALTINGKQITLRDKSGRVVSSVNYSSGWYGDPAKDHGGWSLELIDPSNPCGGSENWEASNDPEGGTPGKINSVFASNPDIKPPALVRASWLSNHSAKLYFDEPLDSTSILNTFIYKVNKGAGSPDSLIACGPEYQNIILVFKKTFSETVKYTVTLDHLLEDCAGNIIENHDTASFSEPAHIAPSDIIINEILFNPKADGVDFVEIYNRSAKTVDLDEIMIGSVSSSGLETDTIPDEDYLMFPGTYLVLTVDPDKVREQYFTENPAAFIKMNSMPSYNNDSGRVVIVKRDQTVIDDFSYNSNMHFALLNDVEGVSLERVNFNSATNLKTNWHSAAETAGFATPGYKNSQYSDEQPGTDDFTVSPEVFSPDNDGKDDYLTISYHFSVPGHIGSIIIFDARGRVIRNLVKTEMLGVSGSFNWDGLDNSARMVRMGIYLIYIEVYDLAGNVSRIKKTCVLAGRKNK
ncbi:MAG: lamin tail domain-containing protein [Bacteroidia bacterium]|nr:lamin tail domain-containing protein [Bacteroidia bacterium]